MHRIWVVVGLAGALGACGQGSDSATSQKTSASAAAPKKERPSYCFFKDSETKGWAASRDKDGNVLVTGKAYREDSRYQAQMGKMDVSGSTATVWPTIAPNMTAYGAPNDWWDVKGTIPSSSNVTEVSVRCGEKTLALLKVPPKG